MSIIYQLLIAHILADFFLQSDAMIQGKKATDGSQWKYLALHSLIHAAAAYLIVGQWKLWYIPLVIGLSHFAIDTVKCLSKKDSTAVFVIDQIAHITVILLLPMAVKFSEEGIRQIAAYGLGDIFSTSFLKHLLAYALMLKPSSILLSKFLSRWTIKETEKTSLPDAGQWIGYLERILILTFVFIGSMEGVGFLLAAKSIFRFGDLNKAKDIKTTEYVMIGTMSSFAIAIITGLLLR